MSETTLSSPVTRGGAGGKAVHLLFVAHHPDPRRVGEAIVLDRTPIELGRDGHAFDDLLEGDPWLSRRHAVLEVGARCVLRDLQSRNGTFVNAAAITERPLQDSDVVRIGDLLLVYRASDARAEAARETAIGDPLVLGVGPAAARLLDTVEAVAARRTAVLLTGPPGVGKGLVTRSIHARSGRSGALITFDCGAVADGVAASELFGHTSGAFSGADRTRPGLVEQARGGTLFLDEIGDASPVIQSSLLRLLEEGEVRAVGSDRAVRADVRIVAATNRDLDRDAEDGKFRFDLLTRLRRWVIEVPPLAARREDIGLLALRKAEHHAGRPVVLATSLVETLLLYPFPGNVRELDAVMERVVVEGRSDDVLRLPPGALPDRSERFVGGPDAKGLTSRFRDPPAADASGSGASGGGTASGSSTSGSSSGGGGRAERPTPEALVEVLKAHGGNVTHAAAALGAARHSVYRWCQALGIDPSSYR